MASAGQVPSIGSKGESFSCLFQLLEATLMPQFMASPPSSKLITPVSASVVPSLAFDLASFKGLL